jgi:hypothetical protein
MTKDNNILIKKVDNCHECPFCYVVLEKSWVKCSLLKIDIYDSEIIPKKCPLRTKKVLVKLQ